MPRRNPHTLIDLTDWEPAATQMVLNSRMSFHWMQFAAPRSHEQVCYQIALNRSRIARDKRSLSSVLNLRLAVDLLSVLGVREFDRLWALGECYRLNGLLKDIHVTEVLRRHRVGYTADLYDLLAKRGMDWSLAHVWEQQFPVLDLRLALEANLSETEIRTILDTNELPDRDALRILTAFLPDTQPS